MRCSDWLKGKSEKIKLAGMRKYGEYFEVEWGLVMHEIPIGSAEYSAEFINRVVECEREIRTEAQGTAGTKGTAGTTL